MQELETQVQRIVQAQPDTIILSAPRPGCAHRRAEVRPVPGGWQLERFTDTQAFHENLPPAALCAVLCALLQEEFTQLTAFARGEELRLRLTKRGRVLAVRKQAASPPPRAGAPVHNRQKHYLLPEGTVVPPLVDMGVLTADGRVVASMRDKYRQINRFVELVHDALQGSEGPLRVVDFGCGKSYLTFIMYYYLTNILNVETEMTGLDLKADVVAACNTAAQKYGYSGLRFAVGDIAAWPPGGRVDLVMALHACDTATDHALAAAVAMQAQHIFAVPCCQHELNAQMQSEELALLARYGIVKERAAALMTDAVRANLLEACGYKTQILEFVELEHTPKNLLIRARRAPLPLARRRRALEEVRRLADAFCLAPCLLGLLRAQGVLPRMEEEEG